MRWQQQPTDPTAVHRGSAFRIKLQKMYFPTTKVVGMGKFDGKNLQVLDHFLLSVFLEGVFSTAFFGPAVFLFRDHSRNLGAE